MRESVRRSCLVAVISILSFGPSAVAHARVASSVSAPSIASGVGTVVFGALRPDWDRDNKKRKKVAAFEGGSAALYLLFAGLACGSAVLLRSRQTSAAKSA